MIKHPELRLSDDFGPGTGLERLDDAGDSRAGDLTARAWILDNRGARYPEGEGAPVRTQDSSPVDAMRKFVIERDLYQGDFEFDLSSSVLSNRLHECGHPLEGRAVSTHGDHAGLGDDGDLCLTSGQFAQCGENG